MQNSLSTKLLNSEFESFAKCMSGDERKVVTGFEAIKVGDMNEIAVENSDDFDNEIGSNIMEEYNNACHTKPITTPHMRGKVTNISSANAGVLLMEIPAEGDYQYRQISFKDLLCMVNKATNSLDISV